jgi:hypothetical protein
MNASDSPDLTQSRIAFYTDALRLLDASGIPYLVGGTFAFSRYTKIGRETKDLDVFLRPSDVERTLRAFGGAGYRAELPYPHWLGKVSRGEDFIDVVFASGNGVAQVDDEWFTRAAESEVLGMRLRLCPLEEMIWSKAFVQERERFDGADVLHLIREAGRDLDWARLLDRFGDHWPVLLAHIVLFRYVYPDRRDYVPQAVVEDLARRVVEQRQDSSDRACYGTLLSRQQYLHDIERLGYVDARLPPRGTMTPAETAIWTAAIEQKE